jgi:hypothetical protein
LAIWPRAVGVAVDDAGTGEPHDGVAVLGWRRAEIAEAVRVPGGHDRAEALHEPQDEQRHLLAGHGLFGAVVSSADATRQPEVRGAVDERVEGSAPGGVVEDPAWRLGATRARERLTRRCGGGRRRHQRRRPQAARQQQRHGPGTGSSRHPPSPSGPYVSTLR